ncbi:TPA: type II toxin-antitoxin system HicB family antitoxin [Candidatus Woesearchaeota archaeon]|nr:type II toxin-antitoxin system HicB family antitoxin [Candidatus Woesearchaeota archaeon]|tara:strand:+ start:883 stop:1101 length:219 start_codon:yes stop_codon:yes gene_type:complete
MTQKFTIIVEQGEDGYLLSEVVGLPGCRSQAKTYDELLERTKEAISLYLEIQGAPEVTSKFVGVQQVEVEAV